MNVFFPLEYLNQEQQERKDKLIQKLIDKGEMALINLQAYRLTGKGNKEIDKLSKLRAETVGKIIPKDERIRIAYLQSSVFQKKELLEHKYMNSELNLSLNVDIEEKKVYIVEENATGAEYEYKNIKDIGDIVKFYLDNYYKEYFEGVKNE